jgi:hypothetical protein
MSENVVDGKELGGKFFWGGLHSSEGEKMESKYINKMLPGWVVEYTTKNFLNKREEDEFFDNLKTQPADWWYRNKKIVYDINSSGYRTSEFSTLTKEIVKDSIVLFGCSLTFGTGVAEDETIGYYLQQITGRNVINLGVPASSNYFMTVNSFLFHEYYGTPFGVAFIWTTLDRDCLFQVQNIRHIGAWDAPEVRKLFAGDEVDTQMYSAYNFDINANIRARYNSLMCRKFWQDKSKLVFGSFFETVSHFTGSNMVFSNDKDARDLLHSGRKTNLKAAEKIAKYLGEI